MPLVCPECAPRVYHERAPEVVTIRGLGVYPEPECIETPVFSP